MQPAMLQTQYLSKDGKSASRTNSTSVFGLGTCWVSTALISNKGPALIDCSTSPWAYLPATSGVRGSSKHKTFTATTFQTTADLLFVHELAMIECWEGGRTHHTLCTTHSAHTAHLAHCSLHTVHTPQSAHRTGCPVATTTARASQHRCRPTRVPLLFERKGWPQVNHWGSIGNTWRAKTL